jgi:type I restriction enzyme S subunit
VKRPDDPHPPAGWTETPLAAVADIRFSNVDKKSYASERPVRLCNYTDVYNKEYVHGHEDFMNATASETEIVRFSIRAGDVIITKDSETPDDIGVPAVVLAAPKDLVCGYHLALIRPRSDQISSVFLAKQIADTRISQYYARLANGLTRYGLTNAVVEFTPIWLPTPEEQHEVAAVLRGIDEAILKTEKLIAKLKSIKQGLLHDLLTRGLDDNGELRNPEDHPEQFKETPQGRIPAAWETLTISDLAVYVGSGITPTGGSTVYKREGVLFIRSQNVTFEGLLLDDIAYIDERTHQMMARSEVFAHDVLLNITGASIGRCCTVPEGLGPANVNQHVCIIRTARPRREDAILLAAVLASFIGQRQIDRLNAGSNRQGLNYQQLRSFLVPWPKHEAERTALAARIESADSRIRAEEAYLSKLRAIKRGLMQDLLTGRVRVPADKVLASATG